MRRLALAILVALLTFSAAGATSLLVPEPCSADEPTSGDTNCPPTCVTCGCCFQAAEPSVLLLAASLEMTIADSDAPLPRLVGTDPRDVLHVPRPRRS